MLGRQETSVATQQLGRQAFMPEVADKDESWIKIFGQINLQKIKG